MERERESLGNWRHGGTEKIRRCRDGGIYKDVEGKRKGRKRRGRKRRGRKRKKGIGRKERKRRGRKRRGRKRKKRDREERKKKERREKLFLEVRGTTCKVNMLEGTIGEVEKSSAVMDEKLEELARRQEKVEKNFQTWREEIEKDRQGLYSSADIPIRPGPSRNALSIECGPWLNVDRPTFRGSPDQNPKEFLSAVENYFSVNGIPYKHCARAFLLLLQGNAKCWGNSIQPVPDDFVHLRANS
ncbi:hypothetical protein J437_LFUL002443 [Ladona fulva]|uniref:Uncharacterized protein n=1 Tax=Ladona fulva TaxID=123851 RepID=A0A8K0KM59_LADFU|nr:hypothetical protein J437_LFUL002443 [Ladona fulva]